MTRIFISYAREVLPVARSIADDLAFLDWDVWFDQALSGGQSWWDEILERIRNADVFVVVVCPETLDSQACTLELQYAIALQRHVLPVLVSDAVDVGLLPPSLSKLQVVDMRTDNKQALLHLLRALKRLPEPPTLPQPLPEPPVVPVSFLASLKEEIEGAAGLSRASQWDLVGRLKAALHDPRLAQAAMTLVARMRIREDLLALVAADLDELARNFGRPPDWELKAREELARGNVVFAIKEVRAGTGWGLKEAKELVDSWRAQAAPTRPDA